ncbi:hypothetical protein [Herbiconiux sp. VKM Ac-2851]|nr:hypothetical protein [Herbiconiux sp. VKM Ac-2851]NQX36270.1 hypothetical protein [Herbiconiux sp. VKM Ac-2851]
MLESFWDRVGRIQYEQNVSVRVALQVAEAEVRLESRIHPTLEGAPTS